MAIKKNKVSIVGAGLAGLYCAWKLHQQGVQTCLLEARNRCGGRIAEYSFTDSNQDTYSFDTGPSWFWPEHQPLIRDLLQQLKIPTFKQYTEGDILYESPQHSISRYHTTSPMQGSYRIDGGSTRMIQSLYQSIPAQLCIKGAAVEHIKWLRNGEISISTQGNTADTYTSDYVILALPPRLIAQNIRFTPLLSESSITEMNSIPTWMAGQAKVVFIYKHPFWRDNQLSGESFSQIGPLSEIHDMSYSAQGPFALMGFLGLSPQDRESISDDFILQQCQQQLIRLYGNKASTPLKIYLKDWSNAQYTATKDDRFPPQGHPHYGITKNMQSLAKRNLYIAVSEVADLHGGYMEGAIYAAEKVLNELMKKITRSSSAK